MKERGSYYIVGVSFVLLSAIGFSAKAVMIKLAYYYRVDATTLLFLRMAFSVPFFLVVGLHKSKSEKTNLQISDWIFVILLGFLGYYLSSILDFIGLVYISAGMERLILFIYPTIVVLLSSFLFKQKIRSREIISLAITYIGILIVFFADKVEKTEHIYLGAFLIFLCAFTYAIYLIGSGRMIPRIGAARFTAYAMLVACLSVTIHFFFTHKLESLQLPSEVYVLSFLMAIISTVLPTFLLSQGIKRVGSGVASIIGTIGPVSTVFLAWIFLGETLNLLQIIGTIFVILGVFIVSNRK
ncbi:MAG TPA: DMT family transporter [Leptospiraceae bacterium]|nr:DMT family transporter [Leptospiraceae bacterium]HMX34860.1 DMT family transporter [Leptospiraceae bacterium]HMY30145.1 DMT family transporter [Leptospiraceae bacterium]HMZ64348.1 DMT family transporter [Leptospiraceae bacterium]HNA06606.1 DMT family transporter [Leptospiraceae bacterium]